MHKLHHAVPALALLVLLTTACDDGTTTDPGLDQGPLASQMVGVALETDGVVEAIFDSELTAMAATDGRSGESGAGGVITTDLTFQRTRSCPAGGQVVVDGRIHRTFDTAAREMEATLAGTRTRTDCSFVRDDLTITVNGSAEFDAYRHRIDGIPDGLQTTGYSGSFTAVRSDGEQKSCEISIEVVRDPAAHSRSIDAWICGDHYTRTTTWTPGSDR